ncbi:DNase I-like protein [Patellaria atrata CBS 101060]|uniref:DNase I-like protein n=1 Tax=Patellaria atrata CBS 101060 TaxID=1346257 RepID=A0A9P4SEE4_9PEZI|nr:DNase I-like protein [Patellaria atrata CBS 101060]
MKPTPPSIHDQLKPKPITTANLKQESYFAPPPVHHSVAEKRNEQSSYFPANDVQFPPPPKQIASLRSMDSSDLPSDRPGLPPRRDAPVGGVRPPKQPPDPPPPRRSMDVVRPMIPASEPTSKMMPPPRRTQTLNAQVSAASSPVLSSAKSYSRVSSEMSQEPYQREPTNWDENDSDDEEPPSDKSVPALTDYPDSSQANRRPPLFKAKLHEIATKYDTKLFAVCGEYVCTSGFVTRVWSLLTGELLMSSSHGDTVKVTAIAFRPARDVSEEGNRIWLGTNLGEIHEIDIPTQSTIVTRGNAHTRREILKIYRHASEMWSLDDEGKLLVWPPDETGSPNLQVAPYTSRVPRGHTFSIVAGGKLWIATGKEIRIFQRSGESQIFFPVLEKSLVQPNVGDVTSGAIISSQSDRIYFGHTDGKVTIYSRKDYTCLGVTNVSLYKISSLVGAGDYLWAAYNTGMMYVYDTSSVPWKVKKDWRAHEVTIAGLVADRSSIWKLDRFQVLSLGTDNYIRIWDGMLKEDWLEDDMQNHDADFCSFREVTALVMTWNAGASKPTSLRNDERDANFFRDLLKSQEPPDLLVFGFQELVDLEDKKVTAKSFFKSSKKKDALEQEHMSHQYRNWRDHLMRCIDDYMPNSQYTLLRAANLVGLFSCIFVKSSERTKIRDVNAAEVKLGMGGLHGNKGALMVRFILDDSSICFINCHLAAGQTQTVHRNNDIASIMESTVFPPQVDSSLRSDIFVSGGDGSMILDHEICILNGDLNYRIDAMPRNTVINAVRENNLGKLLERDQLLLSRKRNPGFRLRAFQEREITFAPTYKYDVGTDRYDTSEKKRSPAWCDRLLYRGIGRIRQLDYRRHEVRVSDHRPVTGRFLIRVKTISEKHRYAAREACEQRFEELQQRIASDIKLDYLINVFGIVPKEAQKLLSQ